MSSDKYFFTDGARLRYRDEGAGPVIVLVHGWTLDLEMWNPQADSLRAHFRIIRLDRRGFGLSSGTPDLRRDVLDTLALCRHVNARPSGYVGMSQGARVVLRLAQQQPQFVDRFVLDGPPGLASPADSGTDDLDYAALEALARNAGLEAFRRAWSRHPLTALETDDPARHELLERMIARYPGWDLLSATDVHPDSPWIDSEPPTVKLPGLVLNGALDTPARLRAGEALARALPQCERAVVPRARHLPNLDNAGAYNSLLLQFFSQPSVPGPDALESQ
jgi:pimeloyl-ACP methyl ester carboxylesterase